MRQWPCYVHRDRKYDGGCQALGEGHGELSHGDRVSVLQDEKVLEADGGDGGTMYLTLLNRRLKMVKM